MKLADARRWFSANGGSLRVIGRTPEHAIFQIAIGPHVSAGIGVEHHGRVDIPESGPQFQKAFIHLVDVDGHLDPENSAQPGVGRKVASAPDVS